MKGKLSFSQAINHDDYAKIDILRVMVDQLQDNIRMYNYLLNVKDEERALLLDKSITEIVKSMYELSKL